MAWADRREPAHEPVVRALRTCGALHIPALVLAEACYLVGSRRGPRAELALVQALRDLPVHAPTQDDLERMSELMSQYIDWPLGAADASLAAAERLLVFTIVTLDRRHFGALRPRAVPAFRILP